LRLDRSGRIHIFAAMREKRVHEASGNAREQPPAEAPRRELSPAAQRALAEAEARRAEHDLKSREQPKELNGRAGSDPARYGDWEVKGITSDF
jgi:hypothetical protein